MTTKLKVLKEIASKATPGPWVHDGKNYVELNEGKILWNTEKYYYGWDARNPYSYTADAKHIATFNPQTVLTLLHIIEEQVEALEHWQKYDNAIYKRVEDGDYELDPKGAIAIGVDLDELYVNAKNSMDKALKATAEKIEGINNEL